MTTDTTRHSASNAAERTPSDAATDALPNLVVIGGFLCGSRDLHNLLGRHPDIWMEPKKELNFFVDQGSGNWKKGIDWYEYRFEDGAKHAIRGESSTSYTRVPMIEGVAKRMFATIPKAKLIYIVRDPIERMLVHWVHQYCSLRENRPALEALLEEKNNAYLACSQYHKQLEEFRMFYPDEQILVVGWEDLREDTPGTMERIFRFLGVDSKFQCNRFKKEIPEPVFRPRRRTMLDRIVRPFLGEGLMKKLRQTRHLSRLFINRIAVPELTNEDRKTLVSRLRDDVAKLRETTGQELRQWTL